MAMSKKQEAAARELFGDEYVDDLLTKGEGWTKELEGLGIGFKALSNEAQAKLGDDLRGLASDIAKLIKLVDVEDEDEEEKSFGGFAEFWSSVSPPVASKQAASAAVSFFGQ